MDKHFGEASEMEEIPFKGIAYPYMSHWMKEHAATDLFFDGPGAQSSSPWNKISTSSDLFTIGSSPPSAFRAHSRNTSLTSVHNSPGNPQASLWERPDTAPSPLAAQKSPRPRLRLQIPSTPASSHEIRSLPPMESHSGIDNTRGHAPSTADDPVSVPISEKMISRPLIQGARGQPTLTRGDLIPNLYSSHTNSRVWTNPMTAEKERWEKVEENLGRMELINRSPFVPHNFNEWLEHRKGCAMDRKRREERKLEEKQAASRRDPRLPPPGPRVKIVPFAMGGKVFNDGRSMVLAMPTIWNHWYTPTEEHPQALWPCAEEMKWEGDERKTSKFRRFPALPRYPGNETVAFKHRYILPMLPFDEVWKLPTAESVAAATETTPAEEMQEMEELLGKGLLDAIDCITHDNY